MEKLTEEGVAELLHFEDGFTKVHTYYDLLDLSHVLLHKEF